MKEERLQILLNKFRQGNITSDELNELQEVARKDAFVSDAIEGASQLSHSDFRSSVLTLNRKIEQNTQPRRRRNYWIAAAAAILVLVVGVSVIMRQGRMEDGRVTSSLQDSSSDQLNESKEYAIVLGEEERQEHTYAQGSGVRGQDAAQESESIGRQEHTYAQGSGVRGPEQGQEQMQRQVPEPTSRDARRSADAASAVPEQQVAMERYSADAPPPQTQDTMKNRGPGAAQGYALAMPLDGWDAYYQFIRDNIVVPKEALNAGLEGSVYLEFDLDMEGRATEVRVTTSLSPECDAEAIRLVKQGPVWDVANAQVPIGRLKVDF